MAMISNYFKLAEALESTIESQSVFIIANERKTKTNTIGRYYTVFPNFELFLKHRENYPHCHELLVDHKNNVANPAGRLVFDFDIKTIDADKTFFIIDDDDTGYDVPKNFKTQIENTIYEVIERYYIGVDDNIIEFVWSTSKNPKKFSKHLTVKNVWFDDWVSMSKIFYKLFCIVWDESVTWIHSSKLLDFQIVRNRGSLRMAGSSKLNGYPLILDDDKYSLTDSLIRVYLKSDIEIEQSFSKKNINTGVMENVLFEDDSEESSISTTSTISNNIMNFKLGIADYDEKVYVKAFEIYNTIHENVFKMGKINGNMISLIRLKPHKCILSGKMHKQENAYCVIQKVDDLYIVAFGCHRKCSSHRLLYIGSITVGNLICMVDPNLEPKKSIKKKSTDCAKKHVKIPRH